MPSFWRFLSEKSEGEPLNPYPMSSNTAPPPARLAYRVSEFAALIGVDKSTAYRLVREGRVRYVRLAGDMRIPADAIETFLRGESPPKPSTGVQRGSSSRRRAADGVAKL
jgi:excisionase family DNA binding protein